MQSIFTSSSLLYMRTVTDLYPPQQNSSGDVRVSIQGKQLLSQAQAVGKRDAVGIAAVLRTPLAWVDRVKVRVAYQLKDGYGSSAVVEPSRVTMQIREPASAGVGQVTVSCSTQYTQSAPNVDYCSSTSLPSVWFGSGVLSSSITVRLFDESGTLIATAPIGQLTLNARPSWWDASLQSSTVGSGLSAPLGVSGGGVFISLPISPVHAGERFHAHMYAHTAGLSLSAWRVRLYFGSRYLQYSSFSQNGQFNSASSSASAGEVSWLATGIKSTTSNADVTGTAIFLLRIELSFGSGVGSGTYDGSTLDVFPRATELISGAAFVQDVDGGVFDGRDGVQMRGQLVVALSPTAAGIFASLPGGVLANLAPLTGLATSYPLTIVEVSNDDRTEMDVSVLSSGASCSTVASPSVLSLADCSVVLGASHSSSAAGASVSVSYGVLGAAVSFDVYVPQETSLWLSDSTLNQFGDSAGGTITVCTSDGVTAYPYQRARAVAYADGLDATPLVSFVVGDVSVAGVSGASFDVIEGRQSGSTTVHLGGRLGSEPSAALQVSDSPVLAAALVARVVTDAVWSPGGQPSSQFSAGDVLALSVQLSQSMTAEGDSGFMFVRVVWSDGTAQDVGVSPVSGVEEVGVVVGSSGVIATAPRANGSFWELGVAVGAMKECVTSVVATWKVCGADVAEGVVPLYHRPAGSGQRERGDRAEPADVSNGRCVAVSDQRSYEQPADGARGL